MFFLKLLFTPAKFFIILNIFKVILPSSPHSGKWAIESRVLLNHGQYIGFVRQDGSFVIDSVPSGSYIVQVLNAISFL